MYKIFRTVAAIYTAFVVAKLSIPGSTAKFRRDCVKTCEDVAPNFG
jgi:hypothetical protein